MIANRSMRAMTRYRSRALAVMLIAMSTLSPAALPQAKSSHDWEAVAGGSMSFEVASVRPNNSPSGGGSNVDLLPGDTFVPTGGLYEARNVGLPQLISFAFKLPMDQFKTLVEQVPWIAETRYDIRARANGNPTKDQYRLMLQKVLSDRFKLQVHYETREVPVFELRMIRSGTLGPKLRMHSASDTLCPHTPPAPPSGTDVDADGYPLTCGVPMRLKPTASGGLRFGGRNVTVAQLAASPMRVMADVSRPLIDATGIQGNIDFTLEWALAARNVAGPGEFHADESLPEFNEALSRQLGLRLASAKGPVEFFVIDHVERPSAN